ncbi:hypothetical protein mRhiFer1_010119 [Rhinolophus ferrumequinum]|uniref:Uncharacterized protein n=1 Tax=Rhinolophus ferrumequinum TaxID=59479 RepID=A0A7J7XPG0_RHIFE|nr:hypothetical protein mRhiFer1_010119 [Rhinolophus ferrumequinum]
MNFKKLFVNHGKGKAVALFTSRWECLEINLNHLSCFQKWHLLGHLWLCIELGMPIFHESLLFQDGVSVGWFLSGPQRWLDKPLPGRCKAGSTAPSHLMLLLPTTGLLRLRFSSEPFRGLPDGNHPTGVNRDGSEP